MKIEHPSCSSSFIMNIIHFYSLENIFLNYSRKRLVMNPVRYYNTLTQANAIIIFIIRIKLYDSPKSSVDTYEWKEEAVPRDRSTSVIVLRRIS